MPPKKTKTVEGIVVIIDIGPAVRASTSETFYSQSKQCLIHILQRKIFAEKCQDMVGVILLGSDESDNTLANGDQYQHISVLHHPKFVDWEMIKSVERLPRGSNSGDWLDAIIVAMDLLHDPQDILFNTKKIVLMTDFVSEFTDDQSDDIIAGLKSMEIELSIIGPSFNDDDSDDTKDTTDFPSQPGPSNGSMSKAPNLNWNGKPKSNVQMAGEVLIRRIVAEVDGLICSFDEAIPQLIFFEKKSQSSANWNSMLEIGTNLKIPITGKIKVKRATQASWKKVYAKDETTPINSEKFFHKLDENQTVVEEDEVISGYKYGTTLVPFSSEDRELQYVCEAQSSQLSILGFTHSSHVPLNLRAGDQVLIVTARDHDQDAAVALSAMIQGLSELDMVAITRRVYRKGLNPVMGALFPDITVDYECLIWVALPFEEDVREFSFPSLEGIINRLTEAQSEAMDRYIDAMNLSVEDDTEEECLDPTLLVNPQLQHFFNCLTRRAIAPDEPLPSPSEHILKLLKPAEKRQQKSERVSKEISTHFPLKKEIVVKKKKLDLSDNGVGTASTSDAPVGPVTSSDLRGGASSITKITSASPSADFRALLTGLCPNYHAICREMEEIILQLTESLTGLASSDDHLLPKILDAMKVFRQEGVAIDPAPYNDFLRQLKVLVAARAFNHLWLIVKQDNLGQISQSETLKSDITSEECETFLILPEAKVEAHSPKQEAHVEKYDEMLDDL